MDHCNTKSNVKNFIWVMQKQKENEREGNRRKEQKEGGGKDYAVQSRVAVTSINARILLVSFTTNTQHMGDSTNNC